MVEATKQELSEGRKRLFKMISIQARAAYRTRQDTALLARSAAKPTSSGGGVSFLDLGQDSFKFAN